MYNGRFGVVTDENGLYQMRARYYNPVIRRFINQDVLLGDITNSQSLNRYSYCQGNPVSYLDPFGLSPYNAYNEMGHALLNFVSLIPIIGDIADTINAIWYLSEGNYAEAMICAIGVLPFVGDIFSKGFKWTKVGRGIKFAANVGKVYLGGSGAWQNLENIRTMMANGTGQWYDYLWEGTMFLLNAATCFIGAAGVVDDLSQGVKYLQKMKIQSQMEVRSLDGGYLVTPKKQQSSFRGLLSDYLGKSENKHVGKFYSISNKAGGQVFVSTEKIVQSDISKIVSMTEGNINIISGRHGDWMDNIILEPKFYSSDVERFGNMENVNVFNFAKMDSNELEKLINSGDTTILGWCYSEYSFFMREIFE